MQGNFLDSNVLLYLASDDSRKAGLAGRILRDGGTVNIQVLNEIASVLRRKSRMDWPEIDAFLDAIVELVEVVPLTLETHRAGRDLAARHKLHVYDAMIVAAALEAGCDRLFSEDMHPGLRIKGLTIVNPFA